MERKIVRMLLDKLITGEPWVCSFLLMLLWIYLSVWDVSNVVALLMGLNRIKVIFWRRPFT